MKDSKLNYRLPTVIIASLVIVFLFWATQRGESPAAETSATDTAPAPNISAIDPYSSMLKPLTGEFNETFEKRYINSLLTHQAIAIAMAKLVGDSKEPKIRSISENIISERTAQSSSLRQWASTWGYTIEEPDKGKVATVTDGIRNATGLQKDQLFASEILDHEGGNLSMARLAVVNSNHTELKDLANNIINKQSIAFTEFEAWAQTKEMLVDDGSADAHSQHDQY